MSVPTHINAYKTELAEKQAELTRLNGEVEALKETVATMEQAEREADAVADEAPAEEPAEVETEDVEDEVVSEDKADEVAELENNFTRPELEELAEDAGVESPEDAANKHELAEEIVAAEGDAPESVVEDGTTVDEAPSEN